MVKGGMRLGDARVYEVAERYKELGWRTDDSVFTPGQAIWTAGAFEELHYDFVTHPDVSGRSFEDKLHEQLAATSDHGKQLMAELLYFHLLISATISAPKKQQIVETILGWMARPVPIPGALLPVLQLGFINPGTYFNTGRWAQLRYLVETGCKWKAGDHASRDATIEDPWRFKTFLAAVPEGGAASQRHAILHLLFPTTFDAIVSDDHMARIRKRFHHLAPDEDDADRQLLEIRAALTPRYGEHFDFYDPRLKPLWEQGIDPWAELVKWGAKLYESPQFDADERDYKLKAVEVVPELVEAVEKGGDWQELLRRAVQNPHNNLTNWRVNDSFLGWVEAEPESARAALLALWADQGSPEDRLQAFADLVDKDAVTSPGNRAALGSYLLMGSDPANLPIYKPGPFKEAHRLAGRTASTGTEGARYREALAFCDELIDEFAGRSTPLRDRLDAQAVIWALTKSNDTSRLFDGWSEEDKRAFFAWRQGVTTGSPVEASADDDSESDSTETGTSPVDWMQWAAAECHLPVDYLEDLVVLLRDKGQIVLYGPPGTGKTFVARVLAKALCEGDDDCNGLVQFHPSTTYEDFFEGIRPRTDADGRLSYEVRPGPLARFAALAAENRHKRFVLVIDELNRANLPKVLGELLFLLEYRDSNAFTLYRPETPFRLPDNLWFIATMNTVDRSVALVDAAMRRRFHFVPFYPDRVPVSDVLARICSESESWVAELVDRVNGELAADLGGPDHQLGASHFIRAARTPDGIARVWQYSIEPLIEDQFFGQEGRVQRYRWDEVRRRYDDLIPLRDERTEK